MDCLPHSNGLIVPDDLITGFGSLPSVRYSAAALPLIDDISILISIILPWLDRLLLLNVLLAATEFLEPDRRVIERAGDRINRLDSELVG